MKVGVRHLKDSLSAYLKRAEAGEHIVVTDHGRPVAKLVPPDLSDRLVRMIREGRLIPPRRSGRIAPLRPLPYTPGSKLLSDQVIEDRHK